MLRGPLVTGTVPSLWSWMRALLRLSGAAASTSALVGRPLLLMFGVVVGWGCWSRLASSRLVVGARDSDGSSDGVLRRRLTDLFAPCWIVSGTPRISRLASCSSWRPFPSSPVEPSSSTSASASLSSPSSCAPSSSTVSSASCECISLSCSSSWSTKSCSSRGSEEGWSSPSPWFVAMDLPRRSRIDSGSSTNREPSSKLSCYD